MPSPHKTAKHLDPGAPLVIDTRALSRRTGASRTVHLTAPAPPGLRTGLAEIPEGTKVRLEVRLESVADGILATLAAAAPVAAECARCLEAFTSSVAVHSQDLFSYGQPGGEAVEDGYSLDGDLLDLEPALRDALVLALPLAPRCREDCPGLCPECGAQLAQAGPGHRHDAGGDPRWARLRQFAAPAGAESAPDPKTREENGRGRP
jgi:uncharacterized protein